MPQLNWPEFRSQALLLEDSEMLVLNKPAGISVVGDQHEADIVQLAVQAGEQLLPVHRIDKVTTGIVIFAKNQAAHGNLTRQFNKRTVDKRYLIITKTVGLPPEGVIDLPLTTGRKGLVRVAAPRTSIRFDEQKKLWWVPKADQLANKKLYPSVTKFATLWSDQEFSLLLAQPLTGRKQQLRIHFAWIGHPIFADPLFDKSELQAGWQSCLHSWRLAFDAAWRNPARVQVEALPSAEFWRPVEAKLSKQLRTEILKRAQQYRFDSIAY